MKMVFASVSSSSPLSVAVARTSQSPFPLYASKNQNSYEKNIYFTDFNFSFFLQSKR